MWKFILKGILRDKNRSLLPVAVVAIGVMLTVFLSGYIAGAMGDMVDINARFLNGHVKVVTGPYAENEDQMPIDLALLDVDALMTDLQQQFPDVTWVKRIRFGGLIDVADTAGETSSQGPAVGIAIDLSPESSEVERMNIEKSLVRGKIPQKPGEVLVSEDFAQELELELGDELTYFGSTMYGSMTFKNLIITGTMRFGATGMDRGTIIIDIKDAQEVLDMEDGACEVLGYLPDQVYYDEEALAIATAFNQNYTNSEDEFAPIMKRLKDQDGLGAYLDLVDVYIFIFIGMFVFAMSIVLWNTGLIGGLRRYQEYGIRLALGESKGHIYANMILEAIMVGILGSIVGTILGLIAAYILQTVGIDISEMMPNSTMMMPGVIRAKITPQLYYIGFIPGLFSMVLGNALSGIGIYKRQTAELFKELEV